MLLTYYCISNTLLEYMLNIKRDEDMYPCMLLYDKFEYYTIF